MKEYNKGCQSKLQFLAQAPIRISDPAIPRVSKLCLTMLSEILRVALTSESIRFEKAILKGTGQFSHLNHIQPFF